MGYCAEPTNDMGEYSVEVRRESFYLRGADDYEHVFEGAPEPEHAIMVYPRIVGCDVKYTDISSTGTVEILIEDIPKIRAALDQVERIHRGEKS